MPAGDARQDLGLIEAALATTLGVDGHGHQDLPAHAGASPASCQQKAERLRQTAFTVVLEGVQRGAGGAGERRAPLQLHQPTRQGRVQAEGHAGRLSQAPLKEPPARDTEHLPFTIAARAAWRQQKIKDGLHGAIVVPAPSPDPYGHLSSGAMTTKGPRAPEPVRADGPAQRPVMRARGEWAHRQALWLAVLGTIFMVVTMAVLSSAPGWGYDFEAYYLAALRLARGDGIYQPWTLAEPFRPGPYGLYLYAPPLAVAFLPFTALSLPIGTILWVGLRIALLALACRLMPVSPTVRWRTFAAASFSAATISDLHLGNVSVLVAVLSVLVWRWLDRPAGSIALAACMAIRPTMGLVLIWMLLRRAWRPVVWAIVAGLALIGATVPLVGEQGYRDFFRVLGHVSDVTGVPNNLDLGSTVLRLGLGPTVASLALYLGYAVGIGALLLSLRRDRELGYVVTIGATMLLAPLLWDHYLASLIIPAAFLADRGRAWGVTLPLLTWLPPPFLPLLVLAATVLPLLARERRQPDERELLPSGPRDRQGLIRRQARRASPVAARAVG